MGRVKQPLKVVPNPYGVVDQNGQPCCAVMMHQGEHVPRGVHRYVGASIVAAVEVRAAVETQVGGTIHQSRAADHEIVWEFETAPVDVPDIGYYREHISRNGDLIAADKYTAQRCGITEFVPPSEFLAKAKAVARAAWDEQHGEGDFDAAEKERADAKKVRDAALAAEKPAQKPVDSKPVTEAKGSK